MECTFLFLINKFWYIHTLSGKRRLHKSGSSMAPPESTYGFRNDLEDWHDSEDSSNAHLTESLADSLDKMSIGNNHANIASVNDPKLIGSHRQKSKILDSFSVLDEVSKFGMRTVKASYEVTDLDNDEVDTDTSKCSDKDDDFQAVSYSKHSTSKNYGIVNTKMVATGQSTEVSWDSGTNEKENGGDGSNVTFVHGNMTFMLPPKVAKILFPHQLEGIKWLWGLHIKGMGGILGDDMGLGKTMQVYLN